jgi:hypothetical protein
MSNLVFINRADGERIAINISAINYVAPPLTVHVPGSKAIIHLSSGDKIPVTTDVEQTVRLLSLVR